MGSANGYGAIHMGIGFERSGGELLTLEINPHVVRQCREDVKAAALVVAHNAIRHADQMRDFLEKIEQDPGWEMVTLQTVESDGMAVCCRVRTETDQ